MKCKVLGGAEQLLQAVQNGLLWKLQVIRSGDAAAHAVVADASSLVFFEAAGAQGVAWPSELQGRAPRSRRSASPTHSWRTECGSWVVKAASRQPACAGHVPGVGLADHDLRGHLSGIWPASAGPELLYPSIADW